MTEDRQLNGVEFRADVTTRDCIYRYLDVTTWRYQRRAVWLDQDCAGQDDMLRHYHFTGSYT